MSPGNPEISTTVASGMSKGNSSIRSAAKPGSNSIFIRAIATQGQRFLTNRSVAGCRRDLPPIYFAIDILVIPMLGNIKIFRMFNLHRDERARHGGLTPWRGITRDRYSVMTFCRVLLPTLLIAAGFLDVWAGDSDSEASKFQRNRLSGMLGVSVEDVDGEK